MSIQKKSLISTLQTAKKANVAAEHKGEKQVSAVSIRSMVKMSSTKSMRLTSSKKLG